MNTDHHSTNSLLHKMSEHHKETNSSKINPTNMDIIKQLHTLETKIKENRQNVNEIVNIFKIYEDNDSLDIEILSTLHRVMSHFFESKELSVLSIAEANSAKQKYKKWLLDQYTHFITLLLDNLHSEELQVCPS